MHPESNADHTEGVDRPVREVQAHRMRRFYMAAGATGLVFLLLLAANRFGVLPAKAFVIASAVMALMVAAFYGAFRTGFNRKFDDPSLTVAQIFASIQVINYVMLEAGEGREVLLMLYVVSLLFGIFRLGIAGLLLMAMLMIVPYAMILYAEGWFEPARLPNVPVLGLIVLAAVLGFISLLGGYVGQLRAPGDRRKPRA